MGDGEREYLRDYVNLLLNSEKNSKDSDQKISVHHKYRSVIIDWMIELQHFLRLSEYTLCEAVAIMDRVVQLKKVLLKDFQLVATTAVWIATKIHETRQFSASEMLSFCCDAFSHIKLLRYEKKMLSLTNFELLNAHPTALVDVLLILTDFPVTDRNNLRHLSYYCLDLYLGDNHYFAENPSLVAASCITAAMIVWKDIYYSWNDNVVPIDSGRVMGLVRKTLMSLIFSRFADQKSAYVKFSSPSQYNSLSISPRLHPKRLRAILAEIFPHLSNC